MGSQVLIVVLLYIFCFYLVASNPLTKDYNYKRVGADQNERIPSNIPLQNTQFITNPLKYEAPNKTAMPGSRNLNSLSVQQRLLTENLLRKQFLENNKQWTGSQYYRPALKTSHSTVDNPVQTKKIEYPHHYVPVASNQHSSLVDNNYNTNSQRFAPVKKPNLPLNQNGKAVSQYTNEIKPIKYVTNKPESKTFNNSVFISAANPQYYAENVLSKPEIHSVNTPSTLKTALQRLNSGSNIQEIMSHPEVVKYLQGTNYIKQFMAVHPDKKVEFVNNIKPAAQQFPNDALMNGSNGEITSLPNQHNIQSASGADPLMLSFVPLQYKNTQDQNLASRTTNPPGSIKAIAESRQFSQSVQQPATSKPIPASSVQSATSKSTSIEGLPSQLKPGPEASTFPKSVSPTISETVVERSPLLAPTTTTTAYDSKDQNKNITNSAASVITSESTTQAPANILSTESTVSAATDDDDDDNDEDLPPSVWFSTSDPSFLSKLFGNTPLGVVYFYNVLSSNPEVVQ